MSNYNFYNHFNNNESNYKNNNINNKSDNIEKYINNNYNRNNKIFNNNNIRYNNNYNNYDNDDNNNNNFNNSNNIDKNNYDNDKNFDNNKYIINDNNNINNYNSKYNNNNNNYKNNNIKNSFKNNNLFIYNDVEYSLEKIISEFELSSKVDTETNKSIRYNNNYYNNINTEINNYKPIIKEKENNNQEFKINFNERNKKNDLRMTFQKNKFNSINNRKSKYNFDFSIN